MAFKLPKRDLTWTCAVLPGQTSKNCCRDFYIKVTQVLSQSDRHIYRTTCLSERGSYSWYRAARRIWWILWEAHSLPADPGRQRRRVTPPHCCTSPPLYSGLHGTAEHPPCAFDLTARQQRDTINITPSHSKHKQLKHHIQTQLKLCCLKVVLLIKPKIKADVTDKHLTQTYVSTCLHTDIEQFYFIS